MRPCPICADSSFTTVASAQRLDHECRIRGAFVRNRLTRQPTEQELKDLTDFFHSETADIVQCNTCSLLIRSQHEPPPARAYSEDEYDPAVVEPLYPRYVAAFRAKQIPYRELLPPRARVLEVGSHYGAFLDVAREWGWNAEGVDPGKDTSRFAQSKGFTVHNVSFERSCFPPATFDAVFIWNCFEQIENPHATLEISRRILKPGGLLTIRTPNGLFYAACLKLLHDPGVDSRAQDFLLRAMGYNNLLGFPYLYGHNRATLERLVKRYGFQLGDALNSELLTFPLPENPFWVEQEERAISSEVRLLANSVLDRGSGNLMGPWLECWFRLLVQND
jgi:SAM-dependent methyltransferase